MLKVVTFEKKLSKVTLLTIQFCSLVPRKNFWKKKKKFIFNFLYKILHFFIKFCCFLLIKAIKRGVEVSWKEDACWSKLKMKARFTRVLAMLPSQSCLVYYVDLDKFHKPCVSSAKDQIPSEWIGILTKHQCNQKHQYSN